MENNTIVSLNKDFEGIKKTDPKGIEYWHGRELMPNLGYSKWEKAEEVIARAARACVNSGQAVDNHFHRTGKMVDTGSTPGNLPPEKHIKELKSEKKKFLKN